METKFYAFGVKKKCKMLAIVVKNVVLMAFVRNVFRLYIAVVSLSPILIKNIQW